MPIKQTLMNELPWRWICVFWLLGSNLCLASEIIGPSSRRTGIVITEVMYRPAVNTNRGNMKFVELYNADLTRRDLSGYALQGSWKFIFPNNTILNAGDYLVVTDKPEELGEAYSITNVLGGVVGDLPRDGGEISLVSAAGGVLLEVRYSSSPPWPEAADGAGHSLVLANPSYGERDVRAWSASRFAGGSPGRNEPNVPNPLQLVVINEILANSNSNHLDYVELYNNSEKPLDVSGCFLSDSPETNKFQIPANTILPAYGFVVFDESQLGFGLKAQGDNLFLKHPNGYDILDAIQFEGQSLGISLGRVSDGVSRFRPLNDLTPGRPNGASRLEEIIINEIMYHPISGDIRDEYIELHNRSPRMIDLGSWRLEGGIQYQIPAGTVIPPEGYLVVAANLNQMLARYPHLNSSNTVGNFSGQLSNQGERIALVRPEIQLQQGRPVNQFTVLIDEVTYHEGGDWGNWSDGGGSSSELMDPRSDNDFGSNWADSDESTKSRWTVIQHTGLLDHGRGSISALQVLAQGVGEYLVDDVEVLDANGNNRIPNSTFESGLASWVMQGAHGTSSLETQQGFNSKQSLHLRALTRGDTIANRVLTPLTTPLTAGSTATLRAKVRWLRGHPEILVRLYGNYLEAYGPLELPMQLGSPGLPNSRVRTNSGPVIVDVRHHPVLPAVNQPITISARVEDVDAIDRVVLRYRLDPSQQTVTFAMRDDGELGDAAANDGIFAATVPGQSQGALIAFWIEAVDRGTHAATNRFPSSSSAPVQEGLIRVGEQQPGGALGTYRLWITQSTFTQWSNRSKLDNTPLPVTFVYNGDRVIYNAKALFAGSPHISPGYTTPSGRLSGYVIIFPPDEPFLGATEIVLDWPDRDESKVQEHAVYWMAEQMGLANLYRRFIRLHVNGVTETQRGGIYEDAQQVNSDYISSWYPGQDRGDLHKIEQWFEYDANGSRTLLVAPTLDKFTTAGGEFKVAPYRWTWLKRSIQDSANNYASLFDLAQAVNLPSSEEYTRQLEVFANIEQWMRIFALEHIIGNFDSYGHQIGKNMYAYKPAGGRWEMHMWDIDWLMNASSSSGRVSPTSSLFESEDPLIGRMYAHPPFRRAYFRAVQDAVYGPLEPSRIDTYLDERRAALVANGVSAGSTANGKSWLSQRRNYLLQQLASVNAPFRITSPANPITTNQNWLMLQGTAPVEVADIAINGTVYQVTWSSVTNWQMVVPLHPGQQSLGVQGLDRLHRPLSSAAITLSVVNTSVPESPAGKVVINEILYRPLRTNTAFVEIHNVSAHDLYDLSGWRFQGLDFTFPPGSLIGPNQYRVVVQNPQTFTSAFGNAASILVHYAGQLNPEGELLALWAPSAQAGAELLVDQVFYDDEWPWPVAAAELGSSLQLIDPHEDNQRVANWGAISVVPTNAPALTNIILIPFTQTWKYNQLGEDLGTAWREVNYNDSQWPSGKALFFVESADLPEAKNTPLNLGRTTYYFRTHFQSPAQIKDRILQLYTMVDDGAVVYLNGREIRRIGMPEGSIQAATWSSRTAGDASREGPFAVDLSALLPGDNVLAVEVHQVNATSTDVVFGLALELAPFSESNSGLAITPGRRNSITTDLASLSPVRLSELQGPHSGHPTDSQGDSDPWMELVNPSNAPILLDGLGLFYGREMTNYWAFPAGTRLNAGEYMVVWLDGEAGESKPGELHASFEIALSGVVGLWQGSSVSNRILDYVYYPVIPGKSYGVLWDDHLMAWTELGSPSPGSPNISPSSLIKIRINEWMASNTRSVMDPIDGDFEDWLELYNAGSETVNLEGYRLTDNMTNTTKWFFPTGTKIGPSEFLLIWADEESNQYVPGAAHLHTNFKLSKEGESIMLIGPDGIVIDRVDFGLQTDDLSQGRWPDGDPVVIRDLGVPTPGYANQLSSVPGFIEVKIASLSNAQVKLQWEAEPGRQYAIDYKDHLDEATWKNGGTITASIRETEHLIDLNGASQRFYRIRRLD